SEAPTPQPGGTADPPSAGYAIRISRTKLLRALALVVVAILVAHLAVHIYHYTVRLVPDLPFNAVDVDQEENFSTWSEGLSLLRLPHATGKRFVIAGAVYVGGALGMDKFSDWFVRLSYVSLRLPGGTLVIRHTAETMARTIDYSLLTAIEEGLEMLGVWLFL